MVKLHALGDAPIPPTLRDDLARIAELPAPAMQRFWEALGPSLADPLPPEIEAKLDAFSRDHGAPPAELARAIRGARFLVREAVRRGIPASAFAADLKALLPEHERVERVLVGGYGKAREVLGDQALARALADHGRVADSIAWRVDEVAASHRGEAVAGRVATVTLHFKPAGSTAAGAGAAPSEHVTFQISAQHARSLSELGAALLARAPQTSPDKA
jgi:hypothetical protein